METSSLNCIHYGEKTLLLNSCVPVRLHYYLPHCQGHCGSKQATDELPSLIQWKEEEEGRRENTLTLGWIWIVVIVKTPPDTLSLSICHWGQDRSKWKREKGNGGQIEFGDSIVCNNISMEEESTHIEDSGASYLCIACKSFRSSK